MEKTTAVGMLAGVACIVISIMIDDISGVMSFVNIPSVFIVFGGVICSTIAAYPSKILKGLIPVMKNAFRKKDVDLNADIDMIIDVANIARREGLLALEDAVYDLDNDFFKKGIMLVVDGADPELVKDVMQAEISFIEERHVQSQSVLDQMASYAPAYGMIGTLIGLINMLKNLSDVNSLGPSMSVALITTFYGVVLANLVLMPMSKKLKCQTADELMQKELLLEGLLSIQDGENPRIIRDKLSSFMARSQLKEQDSDSLKAKQRG